MQTSLWRIAEKSALRKDHRFQNLINELTPGYLAWSWQQINMNAAPGIDNTDAREYGENLWKNIEDLHERLIKGTYRARLILRRFIPKAGGKERPLGLPVTEDKVLQTAVAKILEAIYEPDFLNCGFGYRPKISAKDAVKDVSRQLQFGNFNHIVEADIRSFFDSTDHDKLLDMLKIRIDDRKFLNLIRKWLKAGVFEKDGTIINPETGTPQGGIVSPILANIYLHYVLDGWFENDVRQHCQGRVYLCRYADDFVCAFQNERDAGRFYKVLGKRLEKFGLSLAEEKTKMFRLSKWHRQDHNRFDFLGSEFRWGLSRKLRPQVKIRTSGKKYRAALVSINVWCKKHRHLKMTVLFGKLNAKLRGYYNYYGVIGNFESLSCYFCHTVKYLFKWVNRRSQRKSYTWEGFNELMKFFRIEKPRITEKKKQRQFTIFNAV